MIVHFRRHSEYKPNDNTVFKPKVVMTEEWSSEGRAVIDLDPMPYGNNKPFTMTLQAEPGELEGWLKRYAAEKPEEAIVLIAKIYQEAVSKL